jgi:phosphoglucosamine mutase
MARRYFGTDGVRGVVGETLTPDLVERLGRAATLWAGAGRVFVGRDTRGSGPELEEALVRGIVSGGATAILGGVLPTPAIALTGLDLGVVISASHNPPEYNGVKFFDSRGRKLPDAAEEEIEALLDAPAVVQPGSVMEAEEPAGFYIDHVVDKFGSDLEGLRVVVDCANGAYSAIAPNVFVQLGADVDTICDQPNGSNINVGCGATDTAALQREVVARGYDLGVAFDGDGDRVLAVDEHGELVDGDQIIAILALYLGVDVVAVTQMTNHGFHALMDEHGIRVVTTDVGDRYVLEALWREHGTLGGEQSGHVIYLRDHVSGDGLAAALLLCAAIRGRTLSEAAAVMPRWAQCLQNVRVASKELSPPVRAAVQQLNGELEGSGRVLVRPSGTEPLIRVLAEAENADVARKACASLAALVEKELG